MADGIQLAVAIGVPLLTCGATVVWQLAHAARNREDHERRLSKIEADRQHDRDRAEDRDRELMGLLSDIRADVGRARRRNEGG